MWARDERPKRGPAAADLQELSLMAGASGERLAQTAGDVDIYHKSRQSWYKAGDGSVAGNTSHDGENLSPSVATVGIPVSLH